MTSLVSERNSISIDHHLYRTRGKVRTQLVSRHPGKVTVGPLTDASNPMASEFSIGDFRDGIGVEIGDLPDDHKRAWWATAQLRYKNRVILPRLSVLTSNTGLSATYQALDVAAMEIFNDSLWVARGESTFKYILASDQWQSFASMTETVTDMEAGMVGGSERLAIATGTRVRMINTSDAIAGTSTTHPAKYLAFWKDLMWGISEAGQLAYTDDTGSSFTWTNDALLQLPSGSITGLLVARGPDREQHLYAVTKQGLYVHDDRNALFLPTDLELPFHPDGGKGAEVWRGAMFISAGNAIYRFQAGSDQTLVSVMGPDQDHGLPSDKRGVIRKLTGSHNELFAFLDASTATGVSALTTRATRGVRFHHGVTLPAQTGYSTILGWNERGWEAKWLSGATARPVTAAVVGSLSGTYRLWWGANQRVYYMDLPVDVVNPLQVSSSTYESSATLETPWFDFGIKNQKKLALSVILETVNPTSSETVTVEYATDFVETYTTIATQDETGEQEYHLPDDVNREGKVFRAWKFRFTFSRGSTNTNTPQLINCTLVWRPRVQPLYGFTVELDLREDVGGIPPVGQLKNLKESLVKGTLLEMSYKDDDSGDQTYLVDILDWQSAEESGEIDYGIVRLTMAEPIHSSAHEDR